MSYGAMRHKLISKREDLAAGSIGSIWEFSQEKKKRNSRIQEAKGSFSVVFI